MMNLSHWRLLVAVADLRNISRAAQQVGLSQSGASQAIAQIEASLGAPLFVRERREMTLTALGEQVLQHARGMLVELDAIRALGDACSSVKGSQPWFIEAHQFRIDTTDGIGRPTPEGAHRDGVDFVAVLLIGREQIKGGETRIFEADGPNGKRFTMTEPWTMLLLDDATVIHESTPIQPLGEHGHRDTLVLTWRAGGFQGQESPP